MILSALCIVFRFLLILRFPKNESIFVTIRKGVILECTVYSVTIDDGIGGRRRELEIHVGEATDAFGFSAARKLPPL